MKRAALIMAILLLASIPASAQGTARITRHVIASGGCVTSCKVVGAIGQPVAGTLTMKGTLCSGFWCPGLKAAIIQTARVIYRLTFGNIGVTVVALALAVLVALRQWYNIILNLWRVNERTNLPAVADLQVGGGGGSILRSRPVRPVAGKNRDRRKPE